ncbi:hypothetical protein VNI00_017454 [Paramarasmius palmivorus]|uniref:Polyprotein n=1 Tax=Paramarasmius palmivorus TaxID=297713 RepID=A0AAW0B6I8_9AGAR
MVQYNVAGAHEKELRWNIQAATIHEAATKFEGIQYDPIKGVDIYNGTLNRWAWRMVEPPEPTTFKKQFVKGLPERIVNKLIDLGVAPEHSKVPQMILAIRTLENRDALKRHHHMLRETKSSKRGRSQERQMRHTSSNHRERSEKRSGHSPARKIDNRRYKLVKINKRPHSRLPLDNHAPNSSNAKAGPSNPAPAKASTKDEKKPSKTLLCWGCGQPGHVKTDPKCPQYGRPSMYRIADDDSDSAEISGNKSEPEKSVDDNESQQEHSETSSSEGEYILEQYEDYGGSMNIEGELFYAIDDPEYHYDTGESDQEPRTNRGNTHIIEIEQEYNPLEDCGPYIIIEDDIDISIFPRIDLDQYRFEDALNAINTSNAPEASTTNVKLRRSSRKIQRPNRGGAAERRPLVALVKLNGQWALTMFDSGCTLECLSPNFARLTNTKVYPLAEQHSLQLGTVGSRAKFNYGSTVDVEYETIKSTQVYFDIVNIVVYAIVEPTSE